MKKEGKPENALRDFKDIEADYRFDPSIFTQDPDRVSALKYIIDNKLNRVDKTLILIYADCLSFRKMGKRLGFSHTTMRVECNRIKKIILDEYEKTLDMKGDYFFNVLDRVDKAKTESEKQTFLLTGIFRILFGIAEKMDIIEETQDEPLD